MRLLTAACGLLVGTLAACSQLPSSGPSTSAIVQRSDDAALLNYAVVPVDEPVLQALDRRMRQSLAGSFGDRRGGTSETIGVGDNIVVTIWEAANGGLFSTSSGSLGGGSKSTTIPEQPVSGSGTISIPYAGSIRAAGRTPTEVKAAIEGALAGKAIEPQVLVTVKRSVTNTATVTGDAARNAILPLSPGGTRLLDAVSEAGGLQAPTDEVVVELVRGRSSVRVPLTKIISEPRENVYLRADDVVAMLRQPQKFTVFGATGANAEVKFPLTGINLDGAIARVGGLIDLRADPAGVFVFRYEQPAVLRAIGRPEAATAAEGPLLPVVYRIDLRDPNGLFYAKRFEVSDGDLIYVANANLNEIQKFLALVNGVTSPTLDVQRISAGL